MYTKLGYRLSYETLVNGKGVKQSDCRQIIAYWQKVMEAKQLKMVSQVDMLKLQAWEGMK